MPVFGKGRKNRQPVKFTGKEVFLNPETRKREYAGKQFYRGWRARRARIESVFPLLFKGQNFIEQRFSETNRPVVVLDWGCGAGTAIAGFANKYKGKIAAYGFSKDSDPIWLKRKNVKFIHATADHLFRYLKDNSVDLIYSNVGLAWLFTPEVMLDNTVKKMDAGFRYLKKLTQKLSKNGVLAFDLAFSTEFDIRVLKRLFDNHARDAELTVHNGTVYITKRSNLKPQF